MTIFKKYSYCAFSPHYILMNKDKVVVAERDKHQSNYTFYTIFNIQNFAEISRVSMFISPSESQFFLIIEDKPHLRLPSF